MNDFNISLEQGGEKDKWILSPAPWKGHARLKFKYTADWVKIEAVNRNGGSSKSLEESFIKSSVPSYSVSFLHRIFLLSSPHTIILDISD